MTNDLMAIICLITSGFLVVLTVMLWVRAKRESIAASGYFIFMLLSISIWTLFYALKCILPGAELKLFYTKMEYIGIACVPLAFALISKSTDPREQWRYYELLLIALLCATILYFVWVNPNNLYYESYSVSKAISATEVMHLEYGPAFYVLQSLMIITILAIATRIFMKMIQFKVLHVQILLILGSIVLPITTTILYITKVTTYDLTNSSFAISGILLYSCLVRYGVFDCTAYVKRNILELLDEAILVLAADGCVDYVNPAAEKLIQRELVECRDKNMSEIFPGYTREDSRLPMVQRIIRFPERSEVLLSFRTVSISGIQNSAAGRLVVVENITELNEMSQRLDYLLAHDEATGLYNATKLMEIMEEYAASHPGGLAGNVLCSGSICNLDSLATLLSREQRRHLDYAAANFILNNCRPTNIVTRFGENEFVVFSNGTPMVLSELLPMLNRICTAQIPIDNRMITLEFRLGVYVVEDGVDARMALANVAFARRVAMNDSKDRLKIYDKSMKLQHNLYRSLLTPSNEPNYQRDFYLDFQPIVDIRKKQVVGAEAYIRWNHPSLGKIDPKVFIEVFENTGNMAPMGYTILEKVAAALQSMQGILGKDFFLSINISKWQMEEGFWGRIQSLLDKYDIPAQSLVLEMKEYMFKNDPSIMIEFTQAIQKIGVRLAIDDFNWGNSSFANIVELKCDMIKLDSSFPKIASQNSEKKMLISTMNDMCVKLNVCVVAANVETFNDLMVVEDLNIEMGQGFIFSHALSQANFMEYCDTLNQRAPQA